MATSLAVQGHTPTHIASSTLQRAYQTAAAIQKAVHDVSSSRKLQVSVHKELVEKDFCSLEGKSYLDSPAIHKVSTVDSPRRSVFSTVRASAFNIRSSLISNKEKVETSNSESHGSLSIRANAFLDNYILPLINRPLSSAHHTKVIAIVSHGVILSTLLREILSRFHFITVCTEAFEAGYTIGKAPRWNNTGYTVLRLLPKTDPPLPGPILPREKSLSYEVFIQEINVTKHLLCLKRTGGGIGSARADPKQRDLKEFFSLKTVPQVNQVISHSNREGWTDAKCD